MRALSGEWPLRDMERTIRGVQIDAKLRAWYWPPRSVCRTSPARVARGHRGLGGRGSVRSAAPAEADIRHPGRDPS